MKIRRKYRRIAGALGCVAAMFVAGTALLTGADTEDPWKVPSRASRKPNPVPSDEASRAAGKTSYEKNCLSCHGAAGKGDGPAAKDLKKNPGDLSKPAMWDQSDGAIFWKLTEGRAPMPTFEKSTTETERWQIINYMRTLAPKPAASEGDKKGGKE